MQIHKVPRFAGTIPRLGNSAEPAIKPKKRLSPAYASWAMGTESINEIIDVLTL